MTSTPQALGPPGTAAYEPRPAPAGTTVLFALLVSTVLITSSVVYMFLWGIVVPSRATRLGTAMRTCWGREQSIINHPVKTLADLARLGDAADRAERCLRPIYAEQASWTVACVAALFAVAVVIYWAYPLWFVRRRGLTPILREDCPELVDELERLSRAAGLDRAPTFLLAPYASTSGGLAFGRWRRRYVQLDAGLLVGYTTDRGRFQAVVLHELAHLRNRDVDTTYLTMSIWWSFVALALVPTAVVTLHPQLFTTPLRWRPPKGALPLSVGLALLVLTLLLYLTRNAILRVRETYADARVGEAAHGGESDRPAVALRAVVDGLAPPDRWRAALGTHPHPGRRRQAIDDPAAMLSPRSWELFAAGMATAVMVANLRYVFDQLLQTRVIVSSAGTGMICVLGVAVPLVTAVWRAAGRAPAHRLPVRAILPMPVVLVAGYLLGEQLSWVSVLVGWTAMVTGGVEQSLAAAILLLAGAVTLAFWTASVAHTAPSPGRRGRGVLPAVAAAGTAAFLPWFGVWVSAHDRQGLLATLDPTIIVPPLRAGAPGWYAAVTYWAEMDYPPFLYLTHNPLTLPALTLLWLVPVIVVNRRRGSLRGPEEDPYRVRDALITGLVGAVVFALAGAVLLYALKEMVPASVRHDLNSFPYSVQSALAALAVIAQALVAATVATFARRHRPVLIPLAIFTTGSLATGITLLGLNTAGRCVDLYENRPPACFRLPEAGLTADFLHTVLVEGAVATVPAALLGALLQVLVTRLRRLGHPGTADPRPHRPATRVILTTALALLVTVAILGALAEAPHAYEIWTG
ncbi:M48 family metalloprotease [Sphaerisporangium sp. NPDC088356]|uniref:M48 family metalloprotease n=1 Tax=Sphaerisporangium sp. NPDC088356 TaxID=3154871 RepID=UPI0034320F5B